MNDPHLMRLHDLDDTDEPISRTAGRRPRDVGDGVVAEPVEGQLGYVYVDKLGGLKDVDLNGYALRAMTADRVTDYLVAAINRAQARANGAQIGMRERS